MGLTAKSVFFVKLFLIFNAIYIPALGEVGCPPPEDITPCQCTDRPNTILKCTKILNLEDIKEVFRLSKRYTYQEVHILNSSFQYIPTQIFENTTIKELYLMNSSLVTVFEKPPRSNTLLKFHVENTSFQRQTYVNLTNLSNMEYFYVDNFRIRSMDAELSSHLPRSLKQITFRNTQTTSIVEGGFNKFDKLDKVVIEGNRLINTSRETIPRPSYIRFLYLENNQMTSIPNDAFTDMPNLQFLSLKDNNLTGLPQSAFHPLERNLPYLNLEGNPLSCDCLLVWLVKDKPEVLRGTCKTPKRLEGKTLQSLRPGDFNC